MPQCEMCGNDQSSLTTVKVEGAELELCGDCKEFGTEVRTESSSSTSTKYSTSNSNSDESTTNSTGSTTSSASQSGGSPRRDMFDNMDEIAADYDNRIRQARESRSLSQEDLADSLNEKASLIRKLERSDILPSDDVREKLERRLDISLVEGTDTDEDEWSGSSSTTTTLGDVVKRKD